MAERPCRAENARHATRHAASRFCVIRRHAVRFQAFASPPASRCSVRRQRACPKSSFTPLLAPAAAGVKRRAARQRAQQRFMLPQRWRSCGAAARSSKLCAAARQQRFAGAGLIFTLRLINISSRCYHFRRRSASAGRAIPPPPPCRAATFHRFHAAPPCRAPGVPPICLPMRACTMPKKRQESAHARRAFYHAAISFSASL